MLVVVAASCRWTELTVLCSFGGWWWWCCVQVDPSMRSMMALQEERGSTSYSELQSEVTRRSLPQPAEQSQASVFKWSRMPGQVGATVHSTLDLVQVLLKGPRDRVGCCQMWAMPFI